MSKRPHLALEYSGKATKIYQRAFGNDHPITARSLELLGTVYAEIGKNEYTDSLGQCVSAMSKTSSAAESYNNSLNSFTLSDKDTELWHRKDPRLPTDTSKPKVINSKIPTSILKRTNEPFSTQRRKTERHVRFSEPEITVHGYDSSQSRPHLALLTCLFLLFSALGLALYCTHRRRPHRACEELQAALAGIKAGYTLDGVPTHRRAHTHTLSFTHAITHYGQSRDANQPTMHGIGLGEETGVPGGNPRGTGRTCKLHSRDFIPMQIIAALVAFG
ncbi:hypothetical protein QTP70_033117, partial [Hemibagrus guttatus]